MAPQFRRSGWQEWRDRVRRMARRQDPHLDPGHGLPALGRGRGGPAPMMSARMAGLAIAIAVVALAGCKDAGKDDVTRTVKTYYLAVSRGDRRTACHQLARDFRRAVESGRN